jgi:hypothetical protein
MASWIFLALRVADGAKRPIPGDRPYKKSFTLFRANVRAEKN